LKRRSILSKRSIAVALLLSLMLLQFNVFMPEVEATYTYVADPTFAEIGWMDVKRVGWDFNPKELLLYVEYQTNIPNNQNHQFKGNFYLDTDHDPSTGHALTLGSEYMVNFVCVGDSSMLICELYQWDGGLGFVFVKNLSKPFFGAGGNTVEFGVPLTDIGSPTAINIWCIGGGYAYDIIKTKYTYDTGSEDRSITVDGNPADWGADTPDVTDPTGDATPGWADATRFYTTDYSTAGKLYIRMDLAAAPPNVHPEAGSGFHHNVFYIYFDTDRNPGTGKAIGGIGAEYRLYPTMGTGHTSRSVGIELCRWSAPSWPVVSSATLEKAFAGSCLELSLRLSDMGVTGSAMDIYVDYVSTHNDDFVPNSGTFTATKPGAVLRELREASTLILSAPSSSVYFIYANPYRMVSAPPTPWQAAFAAYDATAAGFIYGLCANKQVICFDSDPGIVVAKEPPSDPPFNYGKVLPSSKRVVAVGGRGPNWVVDYYERTGQTPLKAYVGATEWGFETQAGTKVAWLPATADFTHNDLFVIMVFQDSNSNFVLIIYGLGWKGTFAGGILFKEVIAPSLATYMGKAYVYQWKDAGAVDGVPQASEITQVYST